MEKFEQNDLEKETIDSHNTCYENAIRYKAEENAFIKNYLCGLFSFVFVIKLGGSMTEIFSAGLQQTDKGLKAQLNLSPCNTEIYHPPEK